MPQGSDKPVANRVSFALIPLETGVGGDWTLISKGTAGADGGGGDEGDEGKEGEGDDESDGAGEDDDEGVGEGDGLGDDVGAATAASFSPPPHATSPPPVATESESVKKSALRLMGWRAGGIRFEAA